MQTATCKPEKAKVSCAAVHLFCSSWYKSKGGSCWDGILDHNEQHEVTCEYGRT